MGPCEWRRTTRGRAAVVVVLLVLSAGMGAAPVQKQGGHPAAGRVGIDLAGSTAAEERVPPTDDARPATKKRASSDSYVKVGMSADPERPGEDGQQTVTISLAIDKDWHIGANQPGETGVATTVTVRAPTKPDEVQVDYPPGKLVKDPVGDYRIYEDQVEIKARVHRAKRDQEPLEVIVRFAACSDKEKKCLPPATVKRMLP